MVDAARTHPNTERVQKALADAGVITEVIAIADGARTALEAAHALSVDVAQIAKSLVFIAGVEPVLIITSGRNRVATDRVGAHLGCKLRRADADEVRDATGFPIGGVAPLAHVQPLRILFDRDLLDFDRIWAAAGTPHTLFASDPHRLVQITGAEILDVAEVR